MGRKGNSLFCPLASDEATVRNYKILSEVSFLYRAKKTYGTCAVFSTSEGRKYPRIPVYGTRASLLHLLNLLNLPIAVRQRYRTVPLRGSEISCPGFFQLRVQGSPLAPI
jgi:hypothetical protein